MNESVMKEWSKDFATDLPTIPTGSFTDFAPYARTSSQPARVRKLPVLRGVFDAKRFDFTPGLPYHAGWGAAPAGEAMALTFRIQVGPNVLYWLANASDRHVWKVLDQWAAAKTMVLAAEFQDDKVFLVTRNFEMHPGFARMRELTARASELTPKFIADTAVAFMRDEFKHMASTDIPSFPALQHVQACMVTTEQTGGVAVMANHGSPGPDGPVADAVSALAKAMMKPKEPRH